MAERAGEPEAEAPGGVEPITPATGLVIGLRKGRSRDQSLDLSPTDRATLDGLLVKAG